MKIRAASLADICAMQALAAHTATAAHWSNAEYENMIQQAGEIVRHCLIIEDGGTLLGFIIAREVHNEWEIENIAVSMEARRRGLGARLLSELLKLAESRGTREVFLEVRESNRAARALYEQWAFKESGRRKNYYHDPVEDACTYRFSCPREK